MDFAFVTLLLVTDFRANNKVAPVAAIVGLVLVLSENVKTQSCPISL